MNIQSITRQLHTFPKRADTTIIGCWKGSEHWHWPL